jgi:DNA-directed RNA polymerase I, II, and III subunit RPABC2
MSKNDIDDEPVIEEEDDDSDDDSDDGEVKADDDYDEEAKVVEDDDDEEEEEENDDGNGENDDENGEADTKMKPAMLTRDIFGDDDDDDDEDDELNENYLQKLESDVKHNIISEHHPELNAHNIEEVETMCAIIRDTKGQIIDPFHRTVPFVTRYEKARVIGERAKQINSGAKPFIEIDRTMIDGYLIALKEFEQKKIPFIIRRPLPSGASEYWRLADLEIIA